MNQPHKDSICRKKQDRETPKGLENSQIFENEKNMPDTTVIVKLADKDFASLIKKLSE